MSNRKTSSRKCQCCDKSHACFPGSESPATGAYCSIECRKQKQLKDSDNACGHCGVRIHKGTQCRPRKYCSVRCSTAALKTREAIQCKWCGCDMIERADRPSEACSNKCRYARMNLIASIRSKQRKYKADVSAPLRTKKTWQGWCLHTAKQVHRHRDLSVKQLWTARFNTMVSANRYRVSSVKTNLPTESKEVSWGDAVRIMTICPTPRSLKWRWGQKLQSMVKNNERRLKRKAERRKSRVRISEGY